jgi:hypothetical protein
MTPPSLPPTRVPDRIGLVLAALERCSAGMVQRCGDHGRIPTNHNAGPRPFRPSNAKRAGGAGRPWLRAPAGPRPKPPAPGRSRLELLAHLGCGVDAARAFGRPPFNNLNMNETGAGRDDATDVERPRGRSRMVSHRLDSCRVAPPRPPTERAWRAAA